MPMGLLKRKSSMDSIGSEFEAMLDIPIGTIRPTMQCSFDVVQMIILD